MSWLHRQDRYVWKREDAAMLQDQFTGALNGLDHAVVGDEDLMNVNAHCLVREGCFTTMTS